MKETYANNKIISLLNEKKKNYEFIPSLPTGGRHPLFRNGRNASIDDHPGPILGN